MSTAMIPITTSNSTSVNPPCCSKLRFEPGCFIDTSDELSRITPHKFQGQVKFNRVVRLFQQQLPQLVNRGGKFGFPRRVEARYFLAALERADGRLVGDDFDVLR